LNLSLDFPKPYPLPSQDLPKLVQMNSTTPATPGQTHQMPTTLAIDTPAPAVTFSGGSQQTPTVAETFPKRSARSTAKRVNYRALANGWSLPLTRDLDSTARLSQTARTPTINSNSASGESGLSLSNSPELGGPRRSREVSTSDRLSERATANSQTPTAGGKSTLFMGELNDNLSKPVVDEDRSSSLTPPPEELEDLLPAIQYSVETLVPEIKVQATTNAALGVDTQMVNAVDATVRIHRFDD